MFDAMITTAVSLKDVHLTLPSRAGTQVWGPDHHLHVKAHLGRGANWGLFGEDLPDEANRVTLFMACFPSSWRSA
jgi:hypothetical protein